MTDSFGTLSANSNTPELGSRLPSGANESMKDPGYDISEMERSILAEAAKAFAGGQTAFCVDICIDESKS